jgi:ribosome biogenesis GTPase A
VGAELCEAYAAKHNWRSHKGGRLDIYRAANWILRSALNARSGLSLCFLPPVPGGGLLDQGEEGRSVVEVAG